MKWYCWSIHRISFANYSVLGQEYVSYQILCTAFDFHPITAQKNKATSYHLGQLKAKLAKLRRELISPTGGGGGGAGLGFDVARTGIASVGFVGFPSVGKVRY
jgi:hypothetical protein